MLHATAVEKRRVDKLSISTSLLIRAATKLGLKYQLLPEKTVLISHCSRAYYFQGTSFPCNDMVASNIADNKYLTRKLLKSQAMPVPKTVTLRHPGAWQKVEKSRLRFPLVVKPIIAAHGHGSTMYIRHTSTLRQAVNRAFNFMKNQGKGDRVLVEEFFSGHDLRLLVVGNRVVSALRRVPAYVVGDSRRSIKELIQDFNREWKSSIDFDFPLCPIPFDAEIGRYMRFTNRHLSEVPAAGEHVQLRWNGNVSTGGRPLDITSLIHPRIMQSAVRCAQIIKLPIAGIDILAADFTSSDISANNMVVLEVNDSPGIDIHELPFNGHGRPVSRLILQHIFNSNHL